MSGSTLREPELTENEQLLRGQLELKSNRNIRRLSRVLLAVIMLSTCFACFSGITAYAAVDLDVTIVPPADSVTNSGDCQVNLEILTKSDNGYVELLINIEYDADLLALAAPVNTNGYRVVGSKGQLTLNYTDPTGTNTPTPIGNKEVIEIHFTVLENAPDTVTKIRATVHHAYNKRGKNITWTPIYDKSIEIVRINQDITNSNTSSEEVSSQFVVGGDNSTLVKTAGNSVVSRGGGMVAAVILGAVLIFGAGFAVGYLFCMKKHGLTRGGSHADEEEDEYYSRDDDDDGQDGGRPGKSRRDDDYEDYVGNNDDGFYTRPGEDYTVGGDDDYFTSVPVSRTSGDSFPDVFGSATPIGSHSSEDTGFAESIFGSRARRTSSSVDDDDYPELFTAGRRENRRPAQEAPRFDESDTLFGQFSANLDRNVDDGYGGISSGRSRDRSERSRRNR